MNRARRSLYQPEIKMDHDPQLTAYRSRLHRRMRKIVFIFLGMCLLISLLLGVFSSSVAGK